MGDMPWDPIRPPPKLTLLKNNPLKSASKEEFEIRADLDASSHKAENASISRAREDE